MEDNKRALDFSNFDKNDYSKVYLGDFIDKNVIGKKRKYCSEYGTINDKLNFCKKAVSKIRSVTDLSEEAKELTKQLLKFIESNNSKTY